jgi:outer membrane receptor protein involved in Fe transport
VAGEQLCGYYDVNPLKRGRVQNFVTFAENFGDQTQKYNGVDLSATFRRAGITMFGGMNIGRLATNTCFVVDSPQALLHCDVTPPFLANYKAYAVYSLPWWGVQLSGTFQAVPVPSSGGMHQSILATYVATNREIAPSLGRNLASGVNGTATVQLLEPFALHGGHAKQLDLRLGKVLAMGPNRLRLSLDIYNVFNSNDIQTLNTRLSSNNAINQWQRPLSILSPRYLQIGTEFSF